MGWNYRVFHRQANFTDGPQDFYEIREAYYDDEGKVNAWAAEAAFPCGESLRELEDDLGHMSVALGRGVVEITPDGEALA